MSELSARAKDEQGSAMKVRINTHGNPLPERHGEWVDLSTAEEAHMRKGEVCMIDLGVSMQLPDGYYAIMAPRSSTCKRWGLLQANSIGIFESDFCGDGDIWKFPAYAIRDTDVPKGARICQFQVLKKAPGITFQPVDSLGNTNRGGWGSTGSMAGPPDSDSWKRG